MTLTLDPPLLILQYRQNVTGLSYTRHELRHELAKFRCLRHRKLHLESSGSSITSELNTVTTNLFPDIHLVVCLTTGPKPLPKRALHIVRSRASSFK
jgi:hypothetical protein